MRVGLFLWSHSVIDPCKIIPCSHGHNIGFTVHSTFTWWTLSDESNIRIYLWFM